MNKIDDVVDGIRAQRDLISKLEGDQFGWDIVVGDAFVRGMRDIGYKSTAFAIAELADNAVQAGARHVDILFGFTDGAKPSSVAIVDDGHGMEPQMVRASLIWGAGTRENSRDGFGRYGYGLPSASVSQARRVTVFSKSPGGEWHSTYLDIDEISSGAWTTANRLAMPKEQRKNPPSFVFERLTEMGRRNLDSGTVVLWEKLDRVDLKRRAELRNTLIGDLGVIYRNYLVNTAMTVDGETVQPCDPLFLTEGFRYFDLDEDRAVQLPPADVAVEDKATGQLLGRMHIRYARFPATFFRKPQAKHTNKPGREDLNGRLPIADANNGIIFLRNGRQIDVLRPPRGLMGVLNATTDRYWAVEVDFDAALDEMFAITTSKQQVRPESRVWDILRDKGHVFSTIRTMQNDYKRDAATVADAAEEQRKRASIEAIEDAARFRITKPPQETPERKREAQENLHREAEKRAKKAGVPVEVVERQLIAAQEGSNHDVRVEDVSGGAFFRCEQQGGQRVLIINSAHPFYTELYMASGTSARLRAGLEVLLWTLGEAEVDADPESDRRRFYENERASVWSPYLAQSITSLSRSPVLVDPGATEAA